MSTFEVKIEKITVLPHPNADRLELAQVGLYRAVVAKGLWNTGDYGFYIPEYSVLPDELITKLGLEGKLAGSKKNRVVPVKLRGELSQGVVAPLSFVADDVRETLGADSDYAEALGVTKWEPVVPANMGGDVKPSVEFVKWFDIENLKKFPDMFADGELVQVSEKIHGTASCFTFLTNGNDVTVFVTSKGLGSKNLSLKESETNLYWQILRQYKVQSVYDAVVATYKNVTKVGVFGETYGVQDLKYGATNGKLGFSMFDIYVEHEVNGTMVGEWLSPEAYTHIAKIVNLPTVPVYYTGPFSMDVVRELAYGKEQVSGKELHIREGVVVRPMDRSGDNGHRVGKFVSDDYLTRKNGTEYN